MTKEKIRLGSEITNSISTVSSYVTEFQRKVSDVQSSRIGSYGEPYTEVLNKAIDAAVSAFNSVMLPKIEELEKELEAL